MQLENNISKITTGKTKKIFFNRYIINKIYHMTFKVWWPYSFLYLITRLRKVFPTQVFMLKKYLMKVFKSIVVEGIGEIRILDS